MKKLLPLLPPLVLAITMITACEKASPPAPDASNSEQEIERRVQERIAQERQKDQARQLEERDADLRKKERDLADCEAELEKQRERASREKAESDDSTAAADQASPSEGDAPPVVSSGAFYDALSPYGQWLQNPGQSGYVWQPNVGRQNPNWRPYQQGRWALTDQGWTWVSDEPFGWATYHYGRWARLREAGWVWIPGDEWAPAWVSWRSGDDYVGWAPLPPEADFGGSTVITYDSGYSDFSFVPYARFCEPTIVSYIVAPQYNTTIINKTVNITNIVRRGGRNKVVINNAGPQAVTVQQKTGRQVRPLQIRPERGGGRSQVNGDTLTVGVPAPQSGGGRRQPQNVRPLPVADPRASRGAGEQAQTPPQQPPQQQQAGREPRGGVAAPVAETEVQRLQRMAREREQELRKNPRLQNPQLQTQQLQPQRPGQQQGERQTIRNGDQIQPMERGQRQRTEAERQETQAAAAAAADQQRSGAEQAVPSAANPPQRTRPQQPPAAGNGNAAAQAQQQQQQQLLQQQQQQAIQRQQQQQAAQQQAQRQQEAQQAAQAARQAAAQQQREAAEQQQAVRAQRQAERAAQAAQATQAPPAAPAAPVQAQPQATDPQRDPAAGAQRGGAGRPGRDRGQQ